MEHLPGTRDGSRLGTGRGGVCWGWGGVLLGSQARVAGQLQQDEGNLPRSRPALLWPWAGQRPVALLLASLCNPQPPTPTLSSVSVTCPWAEGGRQALQSGFRARPGAAACYPCLAGFLAERTPGVGGGFLPLAGACLISAASYPSPGGWVAGVWLGGWLTV